MNGFTKIATPPARREGPAPTALPCTQLGPRCRALDVTLRIGGLEDGIRSLDEEGTWLLGHTERITFGSPRVSGEDLLVDATLHVGCRHYREDQDGASCQALGFQGPPPPERPPEPAARCLGGDRFEVLEGLSLTAATLPVERSLPVLNGANPCATAPCRTADHTRGAACCRDLQVEILCAADDPGLEALIRARRSPYLCKVDRESDRSVGVEMISACSYLDGGTSCALHGRHRADGTAAKPGLCFDWPDGEVYHPGCVFAAAARA